MDRISSQTPSIQAGLPLKSKAPVKPQKETRETGVKPEIQSQEPQDSVETTRQERIKIFLDKSWMNVSDFVEMGTAAFVGQVVGTAVGFSLMAGTIPIAIGGGVGALGGLLLHKKGWDKKVFGAVKTGMGLALTPFVLAAKGIKKGIGKLIDLVRPSKKEVVKEGSAGKGKGTGKPAEAKGEAGGVLKDSSSKGAIVADKGGAQSVKEETEKEKKRGVLGTLGRAFGTAAKALKAIPKFVYPSIQGATPEEAKLIEETLDKLPLKTVTSTNTIYVDPTLAEDMGAAGVARDLMYDHPIGLDRGHMGIDWMNLNEGVIVHELGHTVDYQSNPIPQVGRSTFGPFGEGPYVFDPTIDTPDDLYAATNHWEDFAQTHKYYHLDPETMKTTNMEKYEAMKEFYEPTLTDKVMDRSGIRKLGKQISKAIDKVPYLRTALSVIGTILGPMEMNIGADKIENGIKEADATKRYQGKMAMAQGLAFSTKVLAPVGLGIALSKYIVDKKLEKGKWTIKEAESFAGKALAAITGPLGMMYTAGVGELLKDTEGKKMDDFKYHDKEAKGFKQQLGEALGMRQFTAEEVDTKRKLPTEEAKLTKDDKIFMAKVGGGAVLGGVAGTVAGYAGGTAAGAALGGVVGGPIGALIGGLVGKVAGSMYLSYQGAKIGAKAGRLLDKESRDAKVKIAKDSFAKISENVVKKVSSKNIKT